MSRSGMFAMMTAHGATTPAGITQVQEKFFASTANNTSHSITADSTPTNGNLMILVVVSDTAVTTPAGWTLVTTQASNTDNYIFRKTASADSATITVSLGAVSDTCAMYYVEVSGLASNLEDKVNGAIAQGAGGTIDSTTTAVTTVANEFIIVVAGLWINNLTQSVTATNNSFSFRGSVSSSNGGGIDNVTVGVGTRIVSATGAYQSTLTLSSGIGANNAGMIATFK